MRRAAQNNLLKYGESHHNSKYSDELIHNIVQSICDGYSREEIKNMYNINGQLIDDIKSGRSHKKISSLYLDKGFSYKEYDNSENVKLARKVCELLQQGYSVGDTSRILEISYNFVFPIYTRVTYKYISKDYNF